MHLDTVNTVNTSRNSLFQNSLSVYNANLLVRLSVCLANAVAASFMH